jgi:hypothetical protein
MDVPSQHKVFIARAAWTILLEQWGAQPFIGILFKGRNEYLKTKTSSYLIT